MVPVPTHGSWHEEQIDELFASLLGKGFDSIQAINGADLDVPQVDVEAQDRLNAEVDEALKGGFRVFG